MVLLRFQVLFDGRLELVDKIYRFIQAASLKGESVLVYSFKGLSRAGCVLSAYFMRKYKWTLHKALEFLNTRRPNLEIRASFYEQMLLLEENILRNPQYKFRFPDPGEEIRKEEALVSNTFENARAFSSVQKFQVIPGLLEKLQKTKKQSIKWADEATKGGEIGTEIVDKPFRGENPAKSGGAPKNSSLKSGSRLKGANGTRCLSSNEQDEKNISTTSSASSTSENKKNNLKGPIGSALNGE